MKEFACSSPCFVYQSNHQWRSVVPDLSSLDFAGPERLSRIKRTTKICGRLITFLWQKEQYRMPPIIHTTRQQYPRLDVAKVREKMVFEHSISLLQL